MKAARQKRLLWIGLMVGGIAVAVGLTLMALRQNINLFFSPSQVAAGEAPIDKPIRLGGLVQTGSVVRAEDKLAVEFVLTDLKHKEVHVAYQGILPDLFREGQGIVTEGRLTDRQHLVATRVLAKHDENYHPPEG